MAHDRPARDASAPAMLQEVWLTLTPQERLERFHGLHWAEAEMFFLSLSAHDQAEVVHGLPRAEQRLWMRLLAPDDAADVIQEAPPEDRDGLLALLVESIRGEVMGLLAYDEEEAGGLMNPRFAHVRPEMRSREALAALRQQAKQQLDMPYYIYVLDRQQRLLGVVSFRELFMAPAEASVRDFMQTEVISVAEDQDQETVAAVIAQHDFLAIPVVDQVGRIKGIVTVDDVIDVVREEATEDIQKLAGMQAFDMPYLRTGFGPLLKKRAGWLMVLFLGEMLTATAMGYFEDEIARAVVLALFVPMIISSGGNSGSQAATLVVRAMALGEVRLRDWWRVLRRELGAGLALGAVLGSIGMLRIAVWQLLFHPYGEHWVWVGLTVGLALVGVVLWGTLSGSMLPFMMQKLGVDPAASSAPFVATLVDVTGLVIYFTVASVMLRGALL
jgi:magnesium transporter